MQRDKAGGTFVRTSVGGGFLGGCGAVGRTIVEGQVAGPSISDKEADHTSLRTSSSRRRSLSSAIADAVSGASSWRQYVVDQSMRKRRSGGWVARQSQAASQRACHMRSGRSSEHTYSRWGAAHRTLTQSSRVRQGSPSQRREASQGPLGGSSRPQELKPQSLQPGQLRNEIEARALKAALGEHQRGQVLQHARRRACAEGAHHMFSQPQLQG